MKYLYHVLSLESLFHNLKCNCIKGDYYSGVSLSRTKYLDFYVGERAGTFFKLELDYSLLYRDYKDKMENTVFVSQTGVSFEGEKELHIDADITNLSKYLTKIILIKSKIEQLKKTDWFTTRGIRIFNNKTAPELINSIYQKYKNIFYIQSGSDIKKVDSRYISNLFKKIETVYEGYTFYYRGNDKVYGKWGEEFREKCIPLDSYNEIITDLVVGYDYKNLKLYKDKQFALTNFSKIKNMNNLKLFSGYDASAKNEKYRLYIFTYTYKPEDIKEDFNKYSIVFEAHLDDINPIN